MQWSVSMKNNTIALIPARGGSKRLPRKNILPLAGCPLIAWTIKAAQKCKYIDKVIVSTDDVEIAEVSQKFGAEIPFLRPAHLATDEASSFGVAEHLLKWLYEQQYNVETLCLLQPTSPLRNSTDLEDAFEWYIANAADAVVGVCKAEHPPLWCNTLPADKNMNNFLQSDVKGKRSQDLPDYYRINGALYIYNADQLLCKNEFFYNEKTFAYCMSNEHSIDIDTEFDFKVAEMLLTNIKDKEQ